jgi:hypothetical protein
MASFTLAINPSNRIGIIGIHLDQDLMGLVFVMLKICTGTYRLLFYTGSSDNVLSFETDQFNIQHGNHSPFLSDMYAPENSGEYLKLPQAAKPHPLTE